MNGCFDNQLSAVVFDGENESDAVVSSGDHRSRRERGGVTGLGRGARHG